MRAFVISFCLFFAGGALAVPRFKYIDPTRHLVEDGKSTAVEYIADDPKLTFKNKDALRQHVRDVKSGKFDIEFFRNFASSKDKAIFTESYLREVEYVISIKNPESVVPPMAPRCELVILESNQLIEPEELFTILIQDEGEKMGGYSFRVDFRSKEPNAKFNLLQSDNYQFLEPFYRDGIEFFLHAATYYTSGNPKDEVIFRLTNSSSRYNNKVIRFSCDVSDTTTREMLAKMRSKVSKETKEWWQVW